MNSRCVKAGTLFAVAVLSSCRFLPNSAAATRPSAEVSAAFDPAHDYFPEKTTFRYTSSVTIEYHRSFKLLTITPKHQRWRFRYLLLQRGAPRPLGYADAVVIDVPVRTYTMEVPSGLQQVLEPLGIDAGLVGLSSLRGVFPTMPRIRRAVEQGRVLDVGGGATVNLEKLIELRPEVILSDFVGASSSMFMVQRIGLTGFPIASRTEKTPLGSAEWVKVLGVLFNREKEANAIFDGIAHRYKDLHARVRGTQRQPAALPTQALGAWRERVVDRQLVQDAGGAAVPAHQRRWQYFYDHPHELILDQGLDADVWPYASPTWKRIQDAINADARLAKFRAIRNGNVYVMGSPPARGVMNDYFGTAYAFPDRILADLVHILHPEVLPDHQLRYFRAIDAKSVQAKAN